VKKDPHRKGKTLILLPGPPQEERGLLSHREEERERKSKTELSVQKREWYIQPLISITRIYAGGAGKLWKEGSSCGVSRFGRNSAFEEVGGKGSVQVSKSVEGGEEIRGDPLLSS